MKNFLLLVIAVLAGLILQELQKLNRPKRVQLVQSIPMKPFIYAPMLTEADLPKAVNP